MCNDTYTMMRPIVYARAGARVLAAEAAPSSDVVGVAGPVPIKTVCCLFTPQNGSYPGALSCRYLADHTSSSSSLMEGGGLPSCSRARPSWRLRESTIAVLLFSSSLVGGLLPVGAGLEQATTASAVLAAAARIEPPGPPFSAPHLSQDLHQLKRQQHASNALSRLAKICVGSTADVERHAVLRDERLPILLSCAAAASCARADGEVAQIDEQSARTIAASLASLATLAAADAVYTTQKPTGGPRSSDAALQRLRVHAYELIERADGLASSMRLPDVVSSRWAARRLLGTAAATPRLDELTCALPYDFFPGLLGLPPAHLEECRPFLPSMAAIVSGLTASALQSEIPFVQQALLTADGRKVRERRHTCWMADEGIGALAYSGKLMEPSPMGSSARVVALRDALRADLGEHFDCCLTNLYAQGGTAACAWHRDPEHGDAIDGAKWARPTFVVSCGETRRYALGCLPLRTRRGPPCGLGGGLERPRGQACRVPHVPQSASA